MKKAIKNILTWTALTVGGLHVANIIIENHATRHHLLDTKTGHFYKFRYGNIYYEKHGFGAPIVLIHNLAPESSGVEWSKIVHQLSKTNTVYVIDLLGCGRSDKPALTYTNFMYVCALNEFLSEVVGKKATVITSGRSSTIALMETLMEESFIEKLILINPTGTETNNLLLNEPKRIMTILYNIPIIGTYLYNVAMRRSYILGRCSSDYCTKKYYITQDMINAYYEACHLNKCNGKYLYASLASEYLNVDVKNAVKNLNIPLLIISGKNENAYGSYESYKDDIHLIKMNDATGMPHVELPRRTCDAITSFIN